MIDLYQGEYLSFLNKFYGGFYRGEVVKVVDKDNGLYKVVVYPIFVNLVVDDIPVAYSNLTNRYGNIILNVGDWVWVFFESGNLNMPIIFDLCNVKFNNLKFDNVSGGYGMKVAFDKFHIEVYDRGVIIFDKDNSVKVILDKESGIDIDIDNSIKVKFDKSSGIDVSVGNNCKFKLDKVSNRFTIKNNNENLYNILNKIYNILVHLCSAGMFVSPAGNCIYLMSSSDLSELSVLMSKLNLFLEG